MAAAASSSCHFIPSGCPRRSFLDRIAPLSLQFSSPVRTFPSLSFTARPLRSRRPSFVDFSAGAGGKGGAGSGGGGRGRWGGDEGGEGHDGDAGGRNRTEALLVLAEIGRSLDSLPKDLAVAIDAGKVPGVIVHRFADLEKSVVMRWLMQFGGFKERLLADDLFLAKVAMECGVGIFTKTAAEWELRGENFVKELDLVLADVVMAIIADFMLVWLPAPTVSLRPSLAVSAGPIAKFFHGFPDNAFQVALAGTHYSFLERIGAIVRNGSNLFVVGTTASLVGTAATNALINARRAVDRVFAGEAEDVPIVSTSVADGVYMAVSSNLRYLFVDHCLSTLEMAGRREITGRTYDVWTLDDDNRMLDLLVEQVKLGNRLTNGVWKHEVYMECINEFNADTLQSKTVEQLKNRTRSWKRTYQNIKSIINSSGFRWDATTQRVTASQFVWFEYIKVSNTGRCGGTTNFRANAHQHKLLLSALCFAFRTGFDHNSSANLLSLFAIDCALGSLLGGLIADRMSRIYPNAGRVMCAQFSAFMGIPFSWFLLVVIPQSVNSWSIFATTLLLMGLTISWCATCANNPMFAEVVPANHRTMIYAFDRAFEGSFSSLAAPLVGILSERIYGYDPKSVKLMEGSAPEAFALSRGLLSMMAVPFGLCCLFYSPLYITFKRDRENTRIMTLKEQELL